MSTFVFQYPFGKCRRNHRWLIVPFFCCLALGCEEKKDKIIAEKVNERVLDFRKKKQEECRLRLLVKAEKMVDSILLAEAQQSMQDSLGRLRPFRPVQPPLIPPIDTAVVQPLFNGNAPKG